MQLNSTVTLWKTSPRGLLINRHIMNYATRQANTMATTDRTECPLPVRPPPSI